VLHHRVYREPGEELASDLLALCPTHHDYVHGMLATRQTQPSLFDPNNYVVV
jgi:hypothetical protein